MNRFLWGIATSLFVILWLVVVPYLASKPHIDLTLMATREHVSEPDHFTDSRGLTYATERATERCMLAVYIAGKKVAAKHHTAPLDGPYRIYMQCMFSHGVMI